MLATGELRVVLSCRIFPRHFDSYLRVYSAYLWCRIVLLQVLPAIVLCVCNINLIVVSCRTFRYRRQLIGAMGVLAHSNPAFVSDWPETAKTTSISNNSYSLTPVGQSQCASCQFSGTSEQCGNTSCLANVDVIQDVATDHDVIQDASKGRDVTEDASIGYDVIKDVSTSCDITKDASTGHEVIRDVSTSHGIIKGTGSMKDLEYHTGTAATLKLTQHRSPDFLPSKCIGETILTTDKDKTAECQTSEIDNVEETQMVTEIYFEDRDVEDVYFLSDVDICLGDQSHSRETIKLANSIDADGHPESPIHFSNDVRNLKDGLTSSADIDPNWTFIPFRKSKRKSTQMSNHASVKSNSGLVSDPNGGQSFQQTALVSRQLVTESHSSQLHQLVTDTPTPELHHLVTDTSTSELRIFVPDTPSSELGNVVTDTPSSELEHVVTDTPSSELGNVVKDTPSSELGHVVTDTPSSELGHVTDTPSSELRHVTDTPSSELGHLVTDTSVVTCNNGSCIQNNTSSKMATRNPAELSPLPSEAPGNPHPKGTRSNEAGAMAELRPSIMLVLVTSCTLLAELVVTLALTLSFLNSVVYTAGNGVSNEFLSTYIMSSNLLTIFTIPLNFIFFYGLSRQFRCTMKRKAWKLWACTPTISKR